MKTSNYTITPKGRVSFANVFKPKLNELSGKNEYSLDLLFPKTQDISAIKNEIKRVIAEKWQGKDMTGKLKLPIKDGDGLKSNGSAYPDEYKGHVFITFKSELKPGIVDLDRQEIIDPSEFYSGCFAKVHYRASAYDHKANKGVALYLNNIQKVGEGDPLSMRVAKAEDVFSGAEEAHASNFAGQSNANFDPLA